MKRKIASILIVAPDYPYKSETHYPFVKNLVEELVRKGCKVTVLSPQSKTSSMLHGKLKRPTERYDTIDGKIIKIYQPYYITIPTKYHDINNHLLRIGLKFFFMRHKLSPDICYCHFWSSGYALLPFAKKKKIPLFVATGESVIKNLFSSRFGVKKLRDYVKGVICVSSKNKDESIALGLTTEDKCVVIPNAINSSVFYKKNKQEVRRGFGISEDAFIVAFVGWFIDRKGPQRVAQALDKVGGVNSFFIGKGELDPICEGILFKGSLPHSEIPTYLNAADVFVLPTLHEGCCNAVIEAMACGLPIVSSNLPFNWDVLDNTNSILVDPNNVNEIADAIKTLKLDKLKYKRLSEGALEKAKNLSIDLRAKAILKFCEGKV